MILFSQETKRVMNRFEDFLCFSCSMMKGGLNRTRVGNLCLILAPYSVVGSGSAFWLAAIMFISSEFKETRYMYGVLMRSQQLERVQAEKFVGAFGTTLAVVGQSV